VAAWLNILTTLRNRLKHRKGFSFRQIIQFTNKEAKCNANKPSRSEAIANNY